MNEITNQTDKQERSRTHRQKDQNEAQANVQSEEDEAIQALAGHIEREDESPEDC